MKTGPAVSANAVGHGEFQYSKGPGSTDPDEGREKALADFLTPPRMFQTPLKVAAEVRVEQLQQPDRPRWMGVCAAPRLRSAPTRLRHGCRSQ